ncbi:cytochrome c-type biogenesis protein [uncultured Aquabacterium sp.]|uniref:cytochrome c-type biogenesis protein n=1 Tax=uncultured Aquabacterium sp. TaxID=158753 RepID=UPI00344D503D
MKRLLTAFMLSGACLAWAAPDRLHALATELRCPVCQNQTLADSNADLARDLKAEIARQIEQGRSDEQIRAFMVQRYGEFVLYEPPVRADTTVLWAGPFALLALGAGALGWRLRRLRQRPPAHGTPTSERQT